MRPLKHSALLGLLLIFALAISGYALGYFWIYHGSHEGLVEKFRALPSTLVYAHFVGGGIALTLGALQLWTQRPSALHRWLGRAYCLCVLIGAMGGGYMAFHSDFGMVTGLGFFIADVLWIYTTALGLRMAMRGNFDAHRRWILRSYALCCAAISLRVLLPLLLMLFSFETSYILVAWLSWSINLLIIEILLARSRTTSPTQMGSLAL